MLAYACVCRASSFYERSSYYKSNDNIAPRLLPKFLLPLIKSRRIRSYIIKKLFPKGIYEYVIVRTKIIDNIFSNALLNKFDQILLFGSGFDSRGICLVDKDSSTIIFELDVNTTISDKLKQYKKRKIDPGNVKYITIDFNSEKIEDKLKNAGFQYNKKTLYILEGITMYLNYSAVIQDFKFITESAGKGSEIVFDYIYQSVLEEKNLYYGEQEIYRRVKKDGEGWTFGLKKGDINTFLLEKDLALIKHMDSNELEKIYFQDENCNIIAKINGTHCIVHAKIKE
ncbi:MAG: SAM-dependent methyltransferase [Candidatus Lokiarchaeota archaeon]|nr:SAM-dependent methyltransferase [Candidatus Lokiarchaeota archaeon]